MTELQEKEFEILREFVKICELLGLRYYLVCGSALGAVKYQGFIPWDDDIDVALPREDYSKFCKSAKQYLPSYYFLQNEETETGYFNIYSKIRDSRTTFIEVAASKINMNHGVYIDVFPLDGYPISAIDIRRVEFMKRLYYLRRSKFINKPKTTKMNVFILLEKAFRICTNPSTNAHKFTELISHFPASDSKIWCNHGNWQGKIEYATKDQYGAGSWATFENIRVRIPLKYDEYLTQKYGKWKNDLPESEKKGHHNTVVMDLKRPYTFYFEYLPNGEIRTRTQGEVEKLYPLNGLV